jgi:hypothetical protein
MFHQPASISSVILATKRLAVAMASVASSGDTSAPELVS